MEFVQLGKKLNAAFHEALAEENILDRFFALQAFVAKDQKAVDQAVVQTTSKDELLNLAGISLLRDQFVITARNEIMELAAEIRDLDPAELDQLLRDAKPETRIASEMPTPS